MNGKRMWIGAATVLVIVAAVVFGTVAMRPARTPTADGATAAPRVKLAIARSGAFLDKVEAQGRIGPPAGSGAKIVFAQAGILQHLDVRVGDRVTAGQPVAELDRSALAAAVAQAQADATAASASYSGGAVPAAGVSGASARLALARARLDTLEQGGPAAMSSRISAQSAARQAAIKVQSDRATLARDEQLLTAGVLAAKDVEAARAQLASDEADQRASDAKVSVAGSDFAAAVKSAQADVATARNEVQNARAQSGVLGGQSASAQAKLSAARIAYANGVLTAPADGVVLSIAKHPGESVDPAQPVMEIGPALGAGVTLSVPADAARRVRVGNPVTLQFQQSRQRTTQGHVIAVVPAVDPATQVATVVVSGAPADAVSGDALAATIVVGRAPGTLVPSSAIVQDPQSGKTVVFVRDAHPKAGESGFSLREVTVRASDAATAVIASGLKPGEAVAAQGGYTLLAPAGG